ncbi:hypothetical protein INR49_011954 [Caranx melampygus]|nr:hypothetical protein INR49_011954 [Caranx melampygus]
MISTMLHCLGSCRNEEETTDISFIAIRYVTLRTYEAQSMLGDDMAFHKCTTTEFPTGGTIAPPMTQTPVRMVFELPSVAAAE